MPSISRKHDTEYVLRLQLSALPKPWPMTKLEAVVAQWIIDVEGLT